MYLSFLIEKLLSSGKSHFQIFSLHANNETGKKREHHSSFLKIAQSACEQAQEKVPFIGAETLEGLLVHLHKRRGHLLEYSTTFGQIYALHTLVCRIGSARHPSLIRHALEQAGDCRSLQVEEGLQFHLGSSLLLPDMSEQGPL